jgi:hypothetical protein
MGASRKLSISFSLKPVPHSLWYGIFQSGTLRSVPFVPTKRRKCVKHYLKDNKVHGKVIEVGKPLPEPEPPVEWSGCVEIRKSAKSGTVRYALKFAYEKGDNRIGELVRGCLADLAEKLPGKIPEGHEGSR